MSAVDHREREVLRSAVGDDNYPDLVAVCDRLDQLETRLAISSEGLARITRMLAEELVAQRLAQDAANDTLGGDDLHERPTLPDTLTPEDSPT